MPEAIARGSSAAKRAEMLVANGGLVPERSGGCGSGRGGIGGCRWRPIPPTASTARPGRAARPAGKWLRAAAYLTCASGNAADPAKAIELALEAAEIYRERLHDVDSAIEQYTRVLERSPGHPQATAALAELAWVRKDWTVALPLLENMAGSAKHALDESARIWHKVAWSSQMLGDMERARAGYRRSYMALPPICQLCSRVATRAHPRVVAGRVPDRAASAVRSGRSSGGSERADHLFALGKAHLALRSAEAAAEALMKALALAPGLTAAREALAEANARIEGRGITLDVTEEVIHEAISKKCDVLVSHHPLIFKPLKRITCKSFTERILYEAVKNDIAVYSAHTNLDAFSDGVSRKMAEKIGLEEITVLSPSANKLVKLVTYIPESHLEIVRNALFDAGAGSYWQL